MPISPPPKTKVKLPKDGKPGTIVADIVVPDLESAANTAEAASIAKSSNTDVLKQDAKLKLYLVALVAEISITPRPPEVDTQTETELSKESTKKELKLVPLVSSWSFHGEMSRDTTPMTSNRLPPSPSFNHKAYSRFNNTHRPTNNNYGNLIKVQTNNGTFTRIHRSVLAQNPRLKKFLDNDLYSDTVNMPLWCCSSDFDGLSVTYIHWLYNGDLPTAVIDVSNKRKVGLALLGLAEEYIIGHKILDRCYMNDIMDAFIKLQVRERWLALCDVVDVVYADTPVSSPIRHMLTDMYAFMVIDRVEKFNFDLLKEMPKAFVVDVLESVVALMPSEVEEWGRFLEHTGKTYYV